MYTLVQTRHQWEHPSRPNKGRRTDVETSYHASTIKIDEWHGVDYFFANAVRSEWAIETGCNGKRVLAYCEDVRNRHRRLRTQKNEVGEPDGGQLPGPKAKYPLLCHQSTPYFALAPRHLPCATSAWHNNQHSMMNCPAP